MTKSPSCLLNTSCSLNYFGRIFPPVRLLHPVLLIDTTEYWETWVTLYRSNIFKLIIFHSRSMHFSCIFDEILSIWKYECYFRKDLLPLCTLYRLFQMSIAYNYKIWSIWSPIIVASRNSNLYANLWSASKYIEILSFK